MYTALETVKSVKKVEMLWNRIIFWNQDIESNLVRVVIKFK